SLPLHGDIARVVECLRFASEDERRALAIQLRERAATLDAVLGRPITYLEVAEAMSLGFSRALHLKLVPGQPSAAELAAARAKVSEKRVRGEDEVRADSRSTSLG